MKAPPYTTPPAEGECANATSVGGWGGNAPAPTQTPVKARLYTTQACHLCDQAAAMLEILPVEVEAIDIAESDHLLADYGLRIPVVATDARAEELDWPFSINDLQAFLEPP